MYIENTDYRIETIDLSNPYDFKLVQEFLADLNFEFQEEAVDYTIILYNLNNEILGTGSSSGNVLKYVAVAPKFRSTSAFAQIITHLLSRLMQHHETIFAYTKPRNIPVFTGLGFNKIATAEPLFAVLEYGIRGIRDYVNELEEYRPKNKSRRVAAIVLNANPFTLGHLCLIERAAIENDYLYVFVVEENLSVFPFDVRWRLIKKSTSHISNLIMLPGGDYIVSGKTFPNYFLKDAKKSEIIDKQAELDITIFRDYIVPVLGITRRYVGKEVYCPTTNAYNRAMKKLLPLAKIEVFEIERKKGVYDGEYISASKIRQAIRENNLEKYYTCIPRATKAYLTSEESIAVRKMIVENEQERHC